MLRPVLAIAAAAACHSPAAPEPARDPGALDLRPIEFRTDDGRAVPAELGRFRVPERRRPGATRTIELVFVRFRAEPPSDAPPIIYLAGGPGAGGTEHARGPRFAVMMALRRVADVIALDQRGTGLSQRLPPCRERWSVALDRPASRAELDAEVERAARRCAERWRSDGVDLDAYNTEDSADDVDALRRAIGAERISLVGASYGSHLGLAVLRRHGRRVDRAILAGVEGPDATVKLPSDQQAMLQQVAALIASDAEAAHAYPDFLGGVAELLAGLDRSPAVAPAGAGPGMAVTRLDASLLIAGALRGPDTIRLLPRAVDEMRRGEFALVLPYLRELRSGTLEAMPAAMDAASGASPERLARIRRERDHTLLGDAINTTYDPIQAGLGVTDLGAGFRAPVRSDVPVLLISGTLDGRTPPHNAEDVRAGLPHAAHLVLDGAGHGDDLFLASPEILALAAAFLRGEPVGDRTIAVPMPRFALPRSQEWR